MLHRNENIAVDRTRLARTRNEQVTNYVTTSLALPEFSIYGRWLLREEIYRQRGQVNLFLFLAGFWEVVLES